MYLCGHQVCTSCGYRQFVAWSTDAPLRCPECDEPAGRIEGAAWPLEQWPQAHAEVTLTITACALGRRPLFH